MLAFVWVSFETSLGLAQVSLGITPTTGVGNLGTTVNTVGTAAQITGGTRPGNGTNLFHSFDQFNVGRPDTAQFLNTTPSLPTYNILGRVTGGNPSNIFGTIDTMSYPGANLFLMNPAGVVFGPNATLHVGGSVTFTTANYLRLADNSRFTAIPGPTDALLSTASITAFGFLGSTPGPITVQGGRLRVDTDQTLALVGGNITVENGTLENGTVQPAQITSPGGLIHLASVVSPGEIIAETLHQAANVNGQSFGALGTIQISQQSRIDTSGEGGGTILIRGGRLIVDDSTISANTVGPDARPHTGPFGAGIDIQVTQDAIIDNGAIIETNAIGPVASDRGSGGVRVTADHIEISGGPKILAILGTNPKTFPFAGIRSNIEPESTAASSGDISLNATSIRIKDFGQIVAQTAGAGNAGHIILKASENIDIDSALVGIGPNNHSGHAGNITFSSSQGNVSFINSTFVSTQAFDSSGSAGNITINAPHGDILVADSSQVVITTRGTGTLGDIQITAHNLHLRGASKLGIDNVGAPFGGNIGITLDGRLTLAGGSFINTGTFGPTPSGDLIIRAPDILITGKESTQESSLFTGTISSGAGGQLRLFTDNLQLADGGTLKSNSAIGDTMEIPSGSGGVISIQGLRSPGTAVTIDGPGSGIFTTAAGTGDGGMINLSARSLTMTDRATITASSTGTVPNPGKAGDISINAGQSLEMRDSSITTQATQASGGNINIQAVDRIRLVNSVVSSSVADGPGGGGNISIDPQVVALQDSKILAQAADGQGGAIKIITSLFLRDANSIVNADAGSSGLNGTVTIQSPTSNLSESLGTLPSEPNQAHSLLTQRCAALANGQASSFVVAGREQLPADPGGWLTSPLAFAEIDADSFTNGTFATIPAIMATHDSGTVSLRRLTPAGFLMANLADSEATGCHS